ncbi:Usp domain-containing protein [Cephalotus follicularis]|uniref:Usp domain-containing protein n=1 Tax=Cephalotus follicularis TaxID=3775 RepID=A0A1Q3BGM9_CEPFO|nr:Usp domain-containing protein [Cephalotus follicularis]
MDVRKIVVVVEDVEAARAALQWALHNLLRHGDLVTLLHVFPSTRSKNKMKTRQLRLKGYHLALSFKEMCNSFFNTNIEIVVTEGDQEGSRIASMVRQIGASMLVVGLHDHSFLYKLALAHSNTANNLNCRVLAIRQPTSPPPKRTQSSTTVPPPNNSTNMDFSQIDISCLHVPEVLPPKIPYRICPSPSAIIWRTSKSRKSREKG